MIQITPSPPSIVTPWQLAHTYDGTNLSVAINYYSTLYTPFTEEKSFLKYNNIAIVGLDEPKIYTLDKLEKNPVHIVLTITVSSLTASTARIDWVNDEKGGKEDKLHPIKLDGNKIQTEARIVIATIRRDKYKKAGVTSKCKQADFLYILQYVNTNLIMANMVFAGIPVIYPVPIAGYHKSVQNTGG